METASYIRSPLARNLYLKTVNPAPPLDLTSRYLLCVEVLPQRMQNAYLESYEDEATSEFVENCQNKSDRVFTQLFHQLCSLFLSVFMSPTSINGFLGRGSMFVLSTAQFQSLMGIDGEWRTAKLLDLGAGDGLVTRQLQPHFREVFVTEMSVSMQRSLQSYGFRVLDVENWSTGSYDVISCLNLLDRCEKPATLLKQMRASLVPGTGRLLLAVVLPFSPYVEFSSSNDHSPEEELKVRGDSWEQQLISLVENVLEPAGFTVQSFTRVPYISEGDLYQPYYLLSDAVFLLK